MSLAFIEDALQQAEAAGAAGEVPVGAVVVRDGTVIVAARNRVEADQGFVFVDAATFAQNAFFFQQRRGKLDMRSLARVDVERVIEEVDVGTLQMHLENLTFSDLCTEDMVAYTDEHFLKLFRLSQLTIEYLLNVQIESIAFRSCRTEALKMVFFGAGSSMG